MYLVTQTSTTWTIHGYTSIPLERGMRWTTGDKMGSQGTPAFITSFTVDKESKLVEL